MVMAEMGEIGVSEVGKNTFLFEFRETKSMERALRDSPWTVNGKTLILKEWKGNQRIDQIKLELLEI